MKQVPHFRTEQVNHISMSVGFGGLVLAVFWAGQDRNGSLRDVDCSMNNVWEELYDRWAAHLFNTWIERMAEEV